MFKCYTYVYGDDNCADGNVFHNWNVVQILSKDGDTIVGVNDIDGLIHHRNSEVWWRVECIDKKKRDVLNEKVERTCCPNFSSFSVDAKMAVEVIKLT